MARQHPYLSLITPMIPAGADVDPRHVLAYILTGRSGLSNMSREEFETETKLCTQCVLAVGKEQAERSAQSWGL